MSRAVCINRLAAVRLAQVLLASGLAAAAMGQLSSAKADLNLYFMNRQRGSGAANFHAYDDQGHFSTFSLQASTTQGFRIFVSERLERPGHDPDRDSLEEYFIEDPGVWKIGKQFLRFGLGHILRDNALSVRSDQEIAAWGLPITFMAADSGVGLPQGVIVSVGANFGVSAAVGRNFSVSPTSLLAVRLPDASPGAGHGYRRAYGAWYQDERSGSGFWLETATLQEGETGAEPSNFIVAAGADYTPFPGKTFSVGYAHDALQRADFFSASATYRINRSMTLLPYVRLKNGQLYDACIAIAWKL